MQKKIDKSVVKAYAQMIIGSLLTALAFNLFFLNNDIAPGGITGVSTILHHLFGVRVGLTSAILNLPLFLIGYRSVGWTFAVRSFLSMLLLSLFIDVLPVIPLTQDLLLATIYGGIVMGIGLGLVMRGGATTGGTDLAAMLVHKRFPAVTVGTFLFVIDCVVVVVAGFVFDTQAALYAMLAVMLSSRLADIVVQGGHTAIQFLIISDEAQAIAKDITQRMDRGATLLSATGAYSGEPRGMLYCVVSRTEVTQLKEIVAKRDPDAFVTVSTVSEAMGEGFAGLRHNLPPSKPEQRGKIIKLHQKKPGHD